MIDEVSIDWTIDDRFMCPISIHRFNNRFIGAVIKSMVR